MYCSKCGAQNDDNNFKCTACGFELHAAAAPPVVVAPAGGETFGGLIPYKNSAALTAYYLGIFSLACGILLGLPALILGIKGVRFASAHPEAKGGAHAWVGIVCGALTTLVSLVVIGLLIFGAASRS